jgi:hypothetical protein
MPTSCRAIGLAAVALLAGGCQDSIAPPFPSVRAPVLDVVADQNNGTFGASGTQILKGFNPTNPHLGDAIVATFFWLGSTNIITSVTDHLADGTPVGNSYSLVEYVTAGGISMATYVATDVRNFPDPNPDQNAVLVVQANLLVPITDGGIMLSAYGGVEPIAVQAMGAHRSASGSSASTVTADPGAIPVDASALVYGVTLANGVVGLTRPTGFTNVATLSDALMKADGEYAVPATAGSVDPQWTWFFTSPSTWLATVLSLKSATPATGNLTVQTSTTGAALDPDGYTVTVDATRSQAIATNGSVTFTQLSAGAHVVTLSGVAANCTVSGGNAQTVTVPSGGTATTTFSVTCEGTPNDFMTGGGKLQDGKEFATFGFEARPTGGKLEWVQHCTKGSDPTSPTCAGGKFKFKGVVTPGSYAARPGYPNCRSWSGTGNKEDATSTFTVTMGCDNGEPGHGTDFIDIQIDAYHNSGYLTGGNIQLHKGKS